MPAFLRLGNFFSNRTLFILLSAAFIVGTTFIFIVPPWEHYDEPGHFEYAWLIANQTGWPREGDYNQTMRREVGASMLEHDFHEYSVFHLLSTDEPISIIIPQTGDVPLYYFLVSLPLRLIKYSDITFQLYVARFVSLGFFLTTIYLAYKITTLLFRKGHPLTWLVPLFLVFLPGFVDIMTAVNNDVAAIASFTFFIYISLILLVKGPSLKRILILLAAVVLCYFSKSTSILAAPISFPVILLSIIKKRKILKTLAISFGAILVVSHFVFSLDTTSPAFFYANDSNYLPARETQEQTPLGKTAVVQEVKKNKETKFFMPFLPDRIDQTKNTIMTLGAWIWADSPTTIQFPRIDCMGTTDHFFFTNDTIAITDTPTYYAFSTSSIDGLTSVCWLAFYANTNPDTPIYWDGILLTEGQFDNETPPSFVDDQAEKAIWDGITVTNLIRNGSGETTWPVASDLTQKVLSGHLNISISNLLSVFDLDHFFWYYRSTLAHLFRSFWGVFGWGQLRFSGTHPYRYFLVISFIGGLGSLLSLRRRLTSTQISIVFFIACVIILQLVMVLFRGAGSWFTHLFIPHSRYFYPAVVPVSLILVSGFYNIFQLLNRKFHLKQSIFSSIFVCVLIASTLWAVLSIVQF